MVKKWFILAFSIVLVLGMVVFAEDEQNVTQDDNTNTGAYVLCDKAKKLCSVGSQSLRSNSDPLWIGNGVVCTSNKKTCINGSKTVRTTGSKPLIVDSSGVICTSNKKTCTIGNYTLRTNGDSQLYVKDGIVCTPNKQVCTNGSKSLTTSYPQY